MKNNFWPILAYNATLIILFLFKYPIIVMLYIIALIVNNYYIL